MTSTITADLDTAAADNPTGRRVRGLFAELADVERDRELCARYAEPGDWPRELDAEARDVWDHIVEALSGGH